MFLGHWFYPEQKLGCDSVGTCPLMFLSSAHEGGSVSFPKSATEKKTQLSCLRGKDRRITASFTEIWCKSSVQMLTLQVTHILYEKQSLTQILVPARQESWEIRVTHLGFCQLLLEICQSKWVSPKQIVGCSHCHSSLQNCAMQLAKQCFRNRWITLCDGQAIPGSFHTITYIAEGKFRDTYPSYSLIDICHSLLVTYWGRRSSRKLYFLLPCFYPKCIFIII